MVPPRLVRRLLLPLFVVVEVALLALMLGVVVVGLVTAPFDRRLRLARLGAMGASYLAVELAALVVYFGVWLVRPLRDPEWWVAVNVRLLDGAVGRVLAAAHRWTGWTLVLDQPAAPPPGPFDDPRPVLVLARHGGIGDSFALVWLLAHHYRRRPRVVLKRLLLWDPMIDIALHRTDSCFLGIESDEALEDQVGRTARSLRPGDALLLFPEGGNWTPGRRRRAIFHLIRHRRIAEAQAAQLMEHVLPPRSGGVRACLAARPDGPIVVVAHTGLERVVSAGDLWRALPFGVPMRVRWWPSTDPPAGPEEQAAWLRTEWAVVDEWIDAQRPAAEPGRQ